MGFQSSIGNRSQRPTAASAHPLQSSAGWPTLASMGARGEFSFNAQKTRHICPASHLYERLAPTARYSYEPGATPQGSVRKNSISAESAIHLHTWRLSIEPNVSPDSRFTLPLVIR